MKNYRFYFVVFLFLSSTFGLDEARSQVSQPIQLNQPVVGTLSPGSPILLYTFTHPRATFIETLLTFEERNFPLAMTLANSQGQIIDQNTGLNYPNFQGAYMFTRINTPGAFTIAIAADGLTEPVPFELILRERLQDEPVSTVSFIQPQSGFIGPRGDIDEYRINLRVGIPVLIVVATPRNILNSIMAILDLRSQVLAINRGFFGTQSAFPFVPNQTQDYVIQVSGENLEDLGPYTVVAKQIQLFNAPFSLTGQFFSSGDISMYRAQLNPNRVYDISVVGVDGVLPSVLLTTNEYVEQSFNISTEENPFAFIPGFTPSSDQPHNLILFAGGNNPPGNFGLTVEERADEPDPVRLQIEQPFSGVIGPVDDVDTFVFTAEEGVEYSVAVNMTWHDLDPAVRVFDSDGNQLYFNDDSLAGFDSLLSNFTLPAAGDYYIQVSSTSQPETPESRTGVYVIELSDRAIYDIGRPLVFEPFIQFEPIAAGSRVYLPSSAFLDETYPLSATMFNDRTGETFNFSLARGEDKTVEVTMQPNDLFRFDVTDGSLNQNLSLASYVPPPGVLGVFDVVNNEQLGALAIDENNVIYYVNAGQGSVNAMDIDGTTRTVATGFPTAGGIRGPNSLAFDSQGRLHVSNGADHSVSRILANGTVERVVGNLNFPVDIAFDENDALYVAQIGSDTIDRFYPDGTSETLVNTVRNPSAIAFSPDGVLHFTNDVSEQSQIFYYLEDEGVIEEFVIPFAISLKGLAFDQEGYLYTTDGIRGFVYRFDRNGAGIPLVRRVSGPMDLAFAYGEFETYLVASNMGFESPANYYTATMISIQTGRRGLPLPYKPRTFVNDWMIME